MKRKKPNPKARGHLRKYYLTYCRQCDAEKKKEWVKKKKEEKARRIMPQVAAHTDGVSCAACETNKARSGRKLCDKCSRLGEQPIIWGKVAAKLEELTEYIKTNAEFPPEITVKAQSRIKDALSLINYQLEEIVGG
jgi:hypothetical protein